MRPMPSSLRERDITSGKLLIYCWSPYSLEVHSVSTKVVVAMLLGGAVFSIL